ncbi:dihydroneopterin aldolase [Sphingomonas sp. MMS24-J45]|uniref:dihydroneopterin aldolase n=1 Tax=Sphingomonas sp. MMS24-J45 TaxID=3238806 RepID=UPI00384DDB0C
MRSMTRVAVRDLNIMADIGINPEEIGRRQPLIVSATMLVDPVEDDAIDATVDYRRVAAAAAELGEQRIALIETFARRLATRCLLLGPVREATVQIDKPRALAAGLASVTVTLTRETWAQEDRETQEMAWQHP